RVGLLRRIGLLRRRVEIFDGVRDRRVGDLLERARRAAQVTDLLRIGAGAFSQSLGFAFGALSQRSRFVARVGLLTAGRIRCVVEGFRGRLVALAAQRIVAQSGSGLRLLFLRGGEAIDRLRRRAQLLTQLIACVFGAGEFVS